jgi:hypothetical protein
MAAPERFVDRSDSSCTMAHRCTNETRFDVWFWSFPEVEQTAVSALQTTDRTWDPLGSLRGRQLDRLHD